MRRFITAAVLLASAAVANANQQTWQFTYTGFLLYPSQFLPDHTLVGTFTGTDLDHDGILEKSELSSFLLDNTIDYVSACPGWVSSESVLSCGIEAFSFNAATRDLSFHTRWEQYGLHEDRSFSRWLSTGGGDHYISNDYQQLYAFVPQTTLVLTDMMAPVPEPGTYAMLASGLAVLGLLHRREPRTRPARHARPGSFTPPPTA